MKTYWLLGLAAILTGATATAQPYSLLLTGEPEDREGFGHSVAVSGERILVGSLMGAHLFERGASGDWVESAELAPDYVGTYVISLDHDRAIVGGFPSRDAWEGSGIAPTIFLFEQNDAGKWSKAAELAVERPGGSASISGDRAILANSGDRGTDDSVDTTLAHVFERDDTGVWSRVAGLSASDRGEGFADYSVSLSGNRAIVGLQMGVEDFGAAYVFEREESGSWIEAAKLQSSDVDTLDFFGTSVSIAGDRAIVGAPKTDQYSGAAYVFERSESGNWMEVVKLQPEGTFGFGRSVSISGDRAIVGSFWAEWSAAGPGEAFVFVRNDTGAWTQVARWRETELAESEVRCFGWSVSISGDRAAVGAPCNLWGSSGAAFVFEATSAGRHNEEVEIPSRHSLSQNYPNPFHLATTISYSLAFAAKVVLSVYDVLGREVQVLAAGEKPAGSYEVAFEATSLPSGIYLYRLQVGDYVVTKQMAVVQ